MNFLLVVMLAGLWFWLLSPGVLRDRRPRSPIASVDSFERFMDTLGPLTDPQVNTVDLGAPEIAALQRRNRHSAVLRRRRVMFRSLAGLVVTTLVVAVVFGGWTWWLPAGAGTLLLSYTILLIRIRRQSELRHRVRHLPDRDEEAGSVPAHERASRAPRHRNRHAIEG